VTSWQLVPYYARVGGKAHQEAQDRSNRKEQISRGSIGLISANRNSGLTDSGCFLFGLAITLLASINRQYRNRRKREFELRFARKSGDAGRQL
jgi:hypothetical protein